MAKEPLVLAAQHVLNLTPTAPFNFDATVHKPGHFPSADNAWEPGTRWQTMLWQGQLLGLRLENAGTVDEPGIRLGVWSERRLSPAFLDGLAEEITYRCNLDMDLSAFTERFQADPQLGPILVRWRGLRPAHFGSLYEYLIIAIVLQNATVRRSVSMMQAMLETYGTALSFDGKMFLGFWPSSAMDSVAEEELRALKVGYRAKSIKRVSAAFATGAIDEYALRGRSLEEQRDVLLRLYGIGPASVGYILFDVFHHWGYIDHISPWEQRIYSKLFFDVDPEAPVPVDQLLELFEERFGEWKSLAVNYIWEDLFWRRKHEAIPWLDALIRL